MMEAKAGSIDYKLSANENQFTPFLSKRLEPEILTQGHFFCFHTACNSRETEATASHPLLTSRLSPTC